MVSQAYPFVARKVLRNERGSAALLQEMLLDPTTGAQPPLTRPLSWLLVSLPNWLLLWESCPQLRTWHRPCALDALHLHSLQPPTQPSTAPLQSPHRRHARHAAQRAAERRPGLRGL